MKREIMNSVKAFAAKVKGGEEPTTEEIKDTVGVVSAAAKDSKGHEGEVLESLRDCKDAVWLKNILAILKEKIEQATKPDEGDLSDVPF